MRSLYFSFAVVAVSLLLVTTDSLAESFLSTNASQSQIKDVLNNTRGIRRGPAPSTYSRPPTSSQRGKTRASSAAPVAQSATSTGAVEGGAVSFSIIFDVNSADLRKDARRFLDKLGDVLNSDDLSGESFLVEGHTDATGPSEYNMELSQQRADAVRDYLIRQHGVNASRLDVIGRGEADLADPDNPGSSINRRVRFVNLGKG